jgi:hypothetical protein
LITRNGHDWTKRFPRIVHAALKKRSRQFVIDGEAVILGVDGISDFNELHSNKQNGEVQLYAFDVMAMDGEDLRDLPLSMCKASLAKLLRGRPDGMFIAPFEQGAIGPHLFSGGLQFRARGPGVEAGRSALSRRPLAGLGQDEKPSSFGNGAGEGIVRVTPVQINLAPLGVFAVVRG